MIRHIKTVACSAAFMGAVLTAQAAAAVDVFIQGASIPSPTGSVIATTGGNSVRELATLVNIKVNFGIGPTATPTDGWAYCVDLFHTLYVGIDPSYFPTNVQYHVTPLSTDSNGHALTASQITQMGGLAALGFSMVGSNAFELSSKLAAIQAAIWTIEYPTTAFTPDPGNPLPHLTEWTAYYVGIAPTLTGTAYNISADPLGVAQNLLIGFPGGDPHIDTVPEPGTWALMIAGFGMTGVAVRRRKAGVVAA